MMRRWRWSLVLGCLLFSSGACSSKGGSLDTEVVGLARQRSTVAAAPFAHGISQLGQSSPFITLYSPGQSSKVLDSFEFQSPIALGDVNKDGLDELVYGHSGGGITVYNQFGHFIPFPSLAGSFVSDNDRIATGDVNGDGYAEIIHGHQGSGSNSGSLTIYARPGTVLGDFFQTGSSSPSMGFFLNGGDVVSCDLDNDGFDEVITAGDWKIYSHPSRPHINEDTLFGVPSPIFVPGESRIVCADFNGDHFDDIALVQPNPPNDGGSSDPGYFTFYSVPGATPVVFDNNFAPPFQHSDGIAAGDVTGDGIAEFAIGHIHLNASSSLPNAFYGPLSMYDIGGNLINNYFSGVPPVFSFGDGVAVGRTPTNLDLDSDGDGLLDSWETNGIDWDGDGCVDLDLPALGASPLHKDIFVEIDAMDCTVAGGDCVAGDTHGHMPTAATLAPVVTAFAAAPVSNPDGTTGINLVLQFGETIPHQNACDFANGCFDAKKNLFFGTPGERSGAACGSPASSVLAAKSAAFHYNIFAHNQSGGSGSSGIAEGSSNDLIVTLFNFRAGLPNGNPGDQAGTFMHELGHNLGLGHGGADAINRKPNYLSVMNYDYQLGLLPGNTLDYSRVALPSLFELGGTTNGLSEPLGIQDPTTSFQSWYRCPNGRWTTDNSFGALDWSCNDFNGDGKVKNDTNIVSDVNNDRICVQSGKNNTLQSAPGGDDVRLGGLILPGPNGKLESAVKSLGRRGDDVISGNAIFAGANGVLETAPVFDDFPVNRLDPGANGTVDGVRLGDDVAVSVITAGVNGTLQTTPAVGSDDISSLNQIMAGPNGTLETAPLAGSDDQLLVLQIQPGPNFVLDSLPALDDVRTPTLIAPGPDGVLDSNLVSGGLLGDDLVVGGNVDPGLQLGDNVMQTVPSGDDLLQFQLISDGPNRTCETTIAAGSDDTGPFDTARSPGSEQVSQLTGYNDWTSLFYQFRGSSDFANGVHLTVPDLPELTADQAEKDRLAAVVADVTVTIESIGAGSTTKYRVTMLNHGPAAAASPTVNVLLPTGLSFASCSAVSVGSCTLGGTLGVFTLETLGLGASAQAEFTVQPACGFTGPIVTVARVTTSSRDPNLNDNEASVSSTNPSSAPVFTRVPPTVNTSQCHNVSLGTAYATDSCGGTVTITNNAPATYPLGRTVVTWTATNALGASTTATQVVNTSFGDDATCCPAGLHIIQGTSNNDVLNGTTGADCILGKGGQDRINGGGGDDVISGGEGDDIIDGSSGNDRIYGGNGQDTLTGSDGNDLLEGNGGDDQLHGNAGDDVLRGGQGQDKLYGDEANDSLYGEDGSDTLDGGNGNDWLEGGASSADICTGGTGTNQFVSCENRPDAPGAVDKCADGTLDGSETATDCGGGCPGCGTGLPCGASSDCLSLVCSAGACLAPPSPIVASLNITSDWGGGYCATVVASNVGTIASTTWAVRLDVKQAIIYQTTNGSFGASTGTFQVTPVAAQQVIPPGASNSKVSFCANRPTGNTSVPELLSSAGSF